MNPGATTIPRTSTTERPVIGAAEMDSTCPARIPTLRTASSPDSGSITRPFARTRSNVCPNEIPKHADKQAKRSFVIDPAHLTISEIIQKEMYTDNVEHLRREVRDESSRPRQPACNSGNPARRARRRADSESRGGAVDKTLDRGAHSRWPARFAGYLDQRHAHPLRTSGRPCRKGNHYRGGSSGEGKESERKSCGPPAQAGRSRQLQSGVVR